MINFCPLPMYNSTFASNGINEYESLLSNCGRDFYIVYGQNKLFFLFQFPTVMFKGNATLCGELCYEVCQTLMNLPKNVLLLRVGVI